MSILRFKIAVDNYLKIQREKKSYLLHSESQAHACCSLAVTWSEFEAVCTNAYLVFILKVKHAWGFPSVASRNDSFKIRGIVLFISGAN